MQPSLIFIDFEASGLDYWSPDFKTLSCAFAWHTGDHKIKTRYLIGENEINNQLKIIQEAGIPLAAHNASFELGVLLHRFPDFDSSLLQVDTMRLVQVFDNGGKDVKTDGLLSLEDELAMLEGKFKVKTGLSLEGSVSRLLPKDFHNHKQPYYKLLREMGIKKGQEGANLHLLPDDQLESYNTMDAILTLMLYEKTVSEFKTLEYDWTYDHKLHIAACKRIVEAKARGILVDREKLNLNLEATKSEIKTIKDNFDNVFFTHIKDIEAKRWEAWINQPTTERGRLCRASQPAPESIKFNSNSTSQLAELFIDVVGIQPTFYTKESKASKAARDSNPDKPPFMPKPSMKSSHLSSYGDGGVMLASYKKRSLVANQQAKLLELSAKDEIFHFNINPCGTKTGRYTSSGGLNIQALARREEGLVGCLIPREGYTFVSMDLSAGEPSACAHYSQDKNYRKLVFDMVGKKPYWDGELLTLDDVYLAFASLSPLGRAEIRQAWDAGLFETWGDSTKANEEIKTKLKKVRGTHKTIFLGLNYGLGARGLSNNAADQGVHIPLSEAKKIHSTYWDSLFPGVRSFSERLQIQFKRQGYLLNETGYRLVPEHERLCLNHFLQSTVSGEIKLFEQYLLDLAPYAVYSFTWHDESIVEVPDDKLEDFRLVAQQATKKLNEFFNWSVEIKTGFVTGKTLYECK